MEKKKHGKKKWIAIIVVAVIVVALVAGAVVNSRRKGSMDATSAVKSAQVTTGSITNTISASGTLEEADTTDIKIPSSITIKKVSVEAGDEIEKGDTLATVDMTSVKEAIYEVRSSISSINDTLKSIKSKTSAKYVSQREMLNAQKSDLNTELKKLLTIKKTGKIKASVSGTIVSVNVTGSDDTSSSSSSTQSSTGTTSSMSSALSGLTGTSADSTEVTAVSLSAKVPVTTQNTASLTSATASSSDTSALSDGSSSDGTTSSSNGSTSESDTSTYSDETATDKNSGSSSSKSGNSSSSSSSSSGAASQSEIEKALEQQSKSSSSASSNSSALINQYTSGSSSSQSSSGLSSSALSSLTSGSSDSTSTASSASSTSDVSYTSAFTVSSGDKMDISLSIDELDILDVEEGQSVTVTLDALDDQEFTGEITKVSHIGTNNGGSTKYTATCQIDKSDDMLVGMNATAVIDIESAENVLTIPLSAVQEENGQSYVYTTNDNGTLGGKTTVTTGLSDDTNVEITDGLSEGDTVYYKDLSGQELTSTQNNISNMGSNMQKQNGGGQMGGGQNDNGGGTPPSGGNGGPGGNGGN